jgi:uncharacterized protein
MKIRDCQESLAELLAGALRANPAGTPLGRSAQAVLVMARAYESDGRTFLASGDPVNALASFWYGFGWIHFGVAYGLLIDNGNTVCPFHEPCENLPPEFSAQLREKTERYEHLLNIARGSVACATEPATETYGFAVRVLLIAEVYAEKGWRESEGRRDEDALAAFSYGHGWLDAAVTTGLCRILAHHELFTV